MSCDHCVKSGTRTSHSAALSNLQSKGEWAAAWTLMMRCPRGHWVSPRTAFCKPCSLQVGQPGPWPPHGVYTRMRPALAALKEGQFDHLVAHHHPRRPDITLFVDPQTGEFVLVDPALTAQAAQPAEQPALPVETPAGVAPAPTSTPEAPVGAVWAPPPGGVLWDKSSGRPVPAMPRQEEPKGIPNLQLAPEQTELTPEQEQAIDTFIAENPPEPDIDEAAAQSMRDAMTMADKVGAFYAAMRSRGQIPQPLAPRQPPSLGMMTAWLTPGQPVPPVDPQTLTAAEAKTGTDGKSRWDRALELVDKLRPVPGQPGVYEYGHNKATGQPYRIDLNNGTCDCEDCQNKLGGAGRCKHELAAQERAARDGVVLPGSGATAAAAPAEVPAPAPAAPAAPPPAAPPKGRAPRGYVEEVQDKISQVTGLSPQDVPLPSSFGKAPAALDETFMLTPQAQELLAGIGADVRFGYAQVLAGRMTMKGRAIGLYGPAGTGKNKVAEALAATLGLPLEETDVNKDTDILNLIGGTGIQKGDTYAGLARIGRALTEGAVVCINEVNRLPPEAQSMFHLIAQEGRFSLPGPEGSEKEYIVHPSSVLVMTWNLKGGTEMPEEALLSRLSAYDVGHPTEPQERDMLGRWAAGSGLPVNDNEVRATVGVVRGLRAMQEEGKLGEIDPSLRLAQSFYTTLKMTGNVNLAVRKLRTVISHAFAGEKQKQWASAEAVIKRFFPSYTGLQW